MANKHYWLNRTVFGTAFLVVFMSGWYVLRNHSQIAPNPAASSLESNANSTVQQNAAPTSVVAPTIKQAAGQIQLSVNTKAFKKVQRVEFYVENRLVGAVYAAPYQVNIDQNNMSAGTHSVTAKVYMANATAETAAASFTNTAASAPPVSQTDETVAAPPSPTETQPPVTVPVVAPPTAVSAIVSANSDTTASVSWTAVSGATSYQVWRDGSMVATSQTALYEDSGLNPGQTYDYQIVAINSAGDASVQSDIAAVTIPTAPDTSATNYQPDTTPASKNTDTDVPVPDTAPIK